MNILDIICWITKKNVETDKESIKNIRDHDDQKNLNKLDSINLEYGRVIKDLVVKAQPPAH